MTRENFIFYKSFLEAVEQLPKKDRGDALYAICKYGVAGEIVDKITPVASAIFTMAKPQLDANNQRATDGRKGAEFGRLGGRPRKIKETPSGFCDAGSENPIGVIDNAEMKTPKEESRKIKEERIKIIPPLPPDGGSVPNGLKIETVETIPPHGTKARGAARFVPPTVAEVAAYCAERGNLVDAGQWHSYYTSNGWKVGKNPMKDWRGAVRTWEKNGYGNGKQSAGRVSHPAANYNNNQFTDRF